MASIGQCDKKQQIHPTLTMTPSIITKITLSYVRKISVLFMITVSTCGFVYFSFFTHRSSDY